jgi:type VI protein secretion system component VasF
LGKLATESEAAVDLSRLNGGSQTQCHRRARQVFNHVVLHLLVLSFVLLFAFLLYGNNAFAACVPTCC